MDKNTEINEDIKTMTISQAKRLINSDNEDADLIAQGFHKLDNNLIENRPPKITWGKIYLEFTSEEKLAYLEHLAATMNHAAYLIQTERNNLGKLCELKEGQIGKLKVAMEQNMFMLQSEITKINEERQSFNEEAVRMLTQIRELTKALGNANVKV